jgi:hypothetical protein
MLIISLFGQLDDDDDVDDDDDDDDNNKPIWSQGLWAPSPGARDVFTSTAYVKTQVVPHSVPVIESFGQLGL